MSFGDTSFMRPCIELQSWSKRKLANYKGMEVLAQNGDGKALKLGHPIPEDEKFVMGYGLSIGSISDATGKREVNAQ